VSPEDVLTLVREVDSKARLEKTAWGQSVVVTTALTEPTVLLWNPDVSVIGAGRRRALGLEGE
jgi:hypothetical protein